MCTASSVCIGAQARVVSATGRGRVDIQGINRRVHQAALGLPVQSYTAGAFAVMASVAEANAGALRHPLRAKAAGGFRDVGNHATAEPLPTCWPLVEQVFHFLVRQVSWSTTSSDTAACMLHMVPTARLHHSN